MFAQAVFIIEFVGSLDVKGGFEVCYTSQSITDLWTLVQTSHL